MTFVDAATGLNNEIVYVTGRSGDTITSMVRAQEGTTAKSWLAGDLANNFYTQGQDAAKAQIPGVQNNSYTYAADTGAANAYAVALSPAPTLAQGAIVGFTAAHANTGASTLAVNGGTAYPIWGSAHSAIQGGEIIANGYVEVEYNPTLNGGNPVYILLENTGGATQVSPATASQHAVQFGQVAGVVGSVRNLVMSVTAASATATLTADEIIVETALGGLRYCLPSFSKTINLATTGAGGMDTGTAPVSGFVALYAIYNPTTGASALVAQNASTLRTNVYSGANMPAGYTASALLSVWPTNGSGQFVIGMQRDRDIGIANVAVLGSSSIVSGASLSLTSNIPVNAVTVSGSLSVNSTALSNITLAVLESTVGVGYQQITGTVAAGTGFGGTFNRLKLSSAQTMVYSTASSSGTPTFTIFVSGYSI
ncbi:hypothetical protein AB4Y43_01450 [Paraburkholderia sp. BR10872]|uniref:hypothetical protein n=1 Tax=Paraburkholderia sp. BR10872 TaxID=3236989 RepID=UPI0034D24CD7